MAMENFMCFLAPHTTLSKARWTKFFEDMWCCVNSLHTCLFTSYAYTTELLVPRMSGWISTLIGMQFFPQVLTMAVDFAVVYRKMWQAVTGISISKSEFLRAGERIHVLERYMNTRMGASVKTDTLPKRLLTESRKCDKKGRTVPLEEMRDQYYRLRGFTPEGKPSPELLKKLEITA